MENFRKRDHSVENEIGKFLDEFLYPKICLDFQRAHTKEEQLLGKDMQLELENIGTIVVDEKAQSHYINRDIPTFAFEIGFYSKEKHRMGWFVRKDLDTEFYLLVWIKAAKTWNLKKEDIEELDCLLVEKRKLEAHLLKKGLKMEDLIGFEKHFRMERESGALMKGMYESFYFFLTTHLEEKPFNIIFRKELLEELASEQWIVTPNSVIDKKNKIRM